jgi:signal transduction histidine kinase/ActR/RegA family two-component response regulator
MEDLPEGSGEQQTPLDFRWLFDSAPACLLVLDRGFRVVAATEAYLSACGITRAEIIGQEILDIAGDHQPGLSPDAVGDLRKSLARVLRDGVTHTMPVRSQPIQRAQGASEIRYWSTLNAPILDRGRVIYIIHRIADITGYVLPEGRTTGQPGNAIGDVDAASGGFVARVSRELRTPLSTILGFAELLALTDLSDEQQERASAIVRAARRLETMMDDILDISRTDPWKVSVSAEAVPAAKVVSDALELMRPLAVSHGVHLDSPPKSGLYIHADQQRLRQVLLNLLSNSVKYNHPGGQVTVAIDSRPGERIRLTVTDTGRGIAERDLDRLFTPFQRLDAGEAGIEGTGLGLALCQRLVTAMGGSVGVTSTPGIGSAFWVELPAAEPAQIPTAGPQRHPAGIRAYASPKTLLYVEDMVENLRLVEQILRQRPSVRLVPAMLGSAALDLASEHHPDLILLDLHLPDISGEELLHRFQADPATSRTPVIILSADADEAQISRLLAAGVAAYVTKPIGVRAFLETVDDLIGQPPPAIPGAPGADHRAAAGVIPGADEDASRWATGVPDDRGQ